MVKKNGITFFFVCRLQICFHCIAANKLTVVQLGPNKGFVMFIFWFNCESVQCTAFCQHDFGCSQFGLNSARPLSHPHCSPPSTSVCVFLFLCSHGISPHRHCTTKTRRRSLLSCFLPHQAVHMYPKKLNQRGNGPLFSECLQSMQLSKRLWSALSKFQYYKVQCCSAPRKDHFK